MSGPLSAEISIHSMAIVTGGPDAATSYKIYIIYIDLITTLIIGYVSIISMLSTLKTIYKDIVHFHLQFKVDFAFNDLKVKNV